MQIFDTTSYIKKLIQHYESYFGVPGKQLTWNKGPLEKLNPEFSILQFLPNEKHGMFCYCTVGMSAERVDNNMVELIVYAPKSDSMLVELLTLCASYHRNVFPLNLNHTVNIGQSWLDNSKCDDAFLSLPYLDGEDLEIFNFEDREIHCYRLIPITETEKDYKELHGSEVLEQLFENKKLDYLNPNRNCLILES